MLRNRFERLFNYHFKERLPQAMLGAMRGNGVNAYWYRETVNFGDLLTPIVLRHHGLTPVHAYPRKARLASTGSILEHLPEAFEGFILGSGFINGQSRRSFPLARILAVRGIHTRDRIEGLGTSITLGDPGLYAGRLMGRRHDPTCALGIIPHHSNLRAPAFHAIAARAPDEVRIISPVAQPDDVFAQIQDCEIIASASLHGLILADALGIPSVWIAEIGLLGGIFKFHDYASAVGRRDWAPYALSGEETLADLRTLASCAPADSVIACQDGLAEVFGEFVLEMKARP